MKKKSNSLTFFFGLASGLLVAFIIIPLAATLFSTTPIAVGKTLSDAESLQSIGLTFLAGIIATCLGVITGVPLAYMLARNRFPGKTLIEGVVNLPIVIPHTAAGVALLMVFGGKGILGRFLVPLGFLFTDHLAGIVVAMMFVSVPFLVNTSREAFALLDVEIERMALLDGASSWQVFFRITLPQAWRGVGAGAIMMWARGISEFGAVVILAYHPRIVPVLLYERFAGYGLYAILPLAAILILIALVVFLIFRLLLSRV